MIAWYLIFILFVDILLALLQFFNVDAKIYYCCITYIFFINNKYDIKILSIMISYVTQNLLIIAKLSLYNRRRQKRPMTEHFFCVLFTISSWGYFKTADPSKLIFLYLLYILLNLTCNLRCNTVHSLLLFLQQSLLNHLTGLAVVICSISLEKRIVLTFDLY